MGEWRGRGGGEEQREGERESKREVKGDGKDRGEEDDKGEEGLGEEIEGMRKGDRIKGEKKSGGNGWRCEVVERRWGRQ